MIARGHCIGGATPGCGKGDFIAQTEYRSRSAVIFLLVREALAAREAARPVSPGGGPILVARTRAQD